MKAPGYRDDPGWGRAGCKGEITAYLSLAFILLVSFTASMIESASIQNAKNYRRIDVNRAIESVFAEYQKELLGEYDIFGLEGSYETGQYSESDVLNRLDYYGTGNMDHKIERIQYLTDNGCQPFYDQIAAYMQHKYGLTAMEDMLGMTAVWKQQENLAGDYEQEEGEANDRLERLLEENESHLPEADNPLAHMEKLKQTPLLDLICPKDMQISDKRVETEGLLSFRNLNHGYGDFSDVAEDTGTISRLLLGEYLLEHFTCATQEERTGPLDYELEYILAGKLSDRENLEQVVKKLLVLRFVPNYAYIQTDGERKAEAEALALTLCTLIAVPAITQAVAQGILLAWAFGETIVDIRGLLKGNRIPLVKSKESWQLRLSSLLTLGTETDYTEGRDSDNGLDYKEYLRILLFLERKEMISLRSLDLIEQILQKEKGLTFFRADHCISRMEVLSVCNLRRGITYQFSTYFGYR